MLQGHRSVDVLTKDNRDHKNNQSLITSKRQSRSDREDQALGSLPDFTRWVSVSLGTAEVAGCPRSHSHVGWGQAGPGALDLRAQDPEPLRHTLSLAERTMGIPQVPRAGVPSYSFSSVCQIWETWGVRQISGDGGHRLMMKITMDDECIQNSKRTRVTCS